MSLSSWYSRIFSRSQPRCGKRCNPLSRPKTARLFVEQLESRITPSYGLTTLGLFNGANGSTPQAGLIMDSSGNLFGTTYSGGANGAGAIFEVAKGSSAITLLASFDGTDSGSPQAGLVMDANGNLYGTAVSGGASGDGAVFELAKTATGYSSTITTLASFNGSNGVYPAWGLIIDSSGNLYGTTDDGGANDVNDSAGDGTIFELAKGSSTITTKASLNWTDGAYPTGIVMDASGNLYGAAADGGADDDGTLFEIAKGKSTITTLASFTGSNGDSPQAGLLMDSSGNLYGTTNYGADGDGSVYELAKASSTIKLLASFNYSNGSAPVGGLIMDASGNLYGTASQGGASGYGAVFELAKGSSTITDLTSFNISNGAYPYGALDMDSSGNFYGITVQGGIGYDGYTDSGDGAVFELLAHTPQLTWYTPSPITYGTPLSSTQLDASATDSITGATVAGTFTYTPAAGTILQAGNQILSVTFTPTDTADYSPITVEAPLVVNQATPVLTWNAPAPIAAGTPLSSTQLDATAVDPTSGSPVAGTFVYTPPAGTVVGSGTSTLSVTFTPTDTTDYTTASASTTLVVGPSAGLSTLGIFTGGNGYYPTAALYADGNGNLYGTTEYGGADGDGTVFEVAAGSGAITTLASFNGSDGAYPVAVLIMDNSGNLYGTTSYGGANGDGTVFELANVGGTYSSTINTLVSFNGADGTTPYCGLVLDGSGNLYGTTYYGGANGDGTIFELALVSSGTFTFTPLASFSGDNGADPEARLILNGGNLYGTTAYGGVNDDGTVFELELANGSNTIDSLASFNGSNGSAPFSGVTMDGSGNLYGTAYYGGADGEGTVFELVNGSSTINTLASFDGSDGAYPHGTLIVDSGGNLFGTTVYGGVSGDGGIFELANGSGTISTLASFDPYTGNGSVPVGGLLMDSSGNLYGTTAYGGAGDGSVFELAAHTPALSWSPPAAITYGTALISTQLDASAADSGTGAAVTGTFVYTPAVGTLLHGGWQTLSVTFTPADTTDYSPITTEVALYVEPATPVLTWSTPASISYGTALSGTQLDATATDPNTGASLSGTFTYTPPAGTIVNRGSTTLTVTFTPTDTTDYTTASASVTLTVTPSYYLSTLASLGGASGTYPEPGLAMDSSGDLYGTTERGGANGDGTVFELAHGSSTVTTLASFNGADGVDPNGVIMDSSGNLYGITQTGGADGDGAIFELAKGSSSITTLASFTSAVVPNAGLAIDSSGNLYGTTSGGSSFEYGPGGGSVFELAKGSSTITTLASFDGYDGWHPLAGLIVDPSGNLYGTTAYGGRGYTSEEHLGDGAVFELVRSSSGTFTFSLLASFLGANGDEPAGALVMDANGDLYGTTEYGGIGFVASRANSGDGVVFELASGSHAIQNVARFNGVNGKMPQTGLVMDSSGNLYGAAPSGGASGAGVIFEFAPASGAFTTLLSFGGPGATTAGLVVDSSGDVYGTTFSGGANNVGTVFELLAPIAGQPPIVINPARATPNPINGIATSLSVLGDDFAGESALDYTWAVTNSPAGAATPTFTFASGVTNGTNGAKNATATFSAPGSYTFQVTLTDPSGLSTVSSVNVTVNDVLTTVAVSPGTVTLKEDGKQQFQATPLDQFGHALTGQGQASWSVSPGIGTISSTGLYTAPKVGAGTDTVEATIGGVIGTATVTVTALPPVITKPASANPNPVTGTSTELQVQASDPQGATLSYSWAVTNQPNGATTPTFKTASSNDTSVTFYQAGSYTFTVTVTDTLGLSATSSVTVTVALTLTSLSITPATVTLANKATQQFTAAALDQFGNALTAPPTFTWQVSSNGGTISSTGPDTALYTAPASGSGTFLVKVSAGGKSAQANVTVTTIPPAPSNLTAKAILMNGRAQVQLRWNNNGTNQTGVIVQVYMAASSGWTTLVTLTGNADNYSYTTDELDTTFEYQVYAYNALGDSPFSNVATLTTP